MTGQVEGPEYHISKNRLVTLVDCIFAFAMTLLVLGISLPKPQDSVAPAVIPGVIEGLFPQVFLFIVAFFVLALFWIGHHRQFHFVHLIDPALLWINILILISIVFVPFSTDVAGDYPDVMDAALLFHASMFIVGVLFFVQWCYICRHDNLCESVLERKVIRGGIYRSLLVPALAVIGGILCFFNPPLSLLVYLAQPGGTYLLRRLS